MRQVTMEELAKEKPWEKLEEVLKNFGYEEDPRRMRAVPLKEYFKLSLRRQETYHDLLLPEETLASRLKEREHPLQESVRECFILEKCRFSDLHKATMEVTVIVKVIRMIYEKDAEGTRSTAAAMVTETGSVFSIMLNED